MTDTSNTLPSNPTNPYQSQIDQLEQQIQANQSLLADPELKELAQQEIAELTAEKQTLEQAATDYQQQRQTDDQDQPHALNQAKAIIEIRAGAGGDEAKIWATDLMRMYMRFCENNHLKFTFIDDLVFKISGKYVLEQLPEPDEPDQNSEQPGSTGSSNQPSQPGQPAQPEPPSQPQTQTLSPFELFRYESGVHRVQRVPATESQGRIHTSTASVAVLPEIPEHVVKIRDEDLDWEFIRASGAGGQSVNKTSSAVRLTHIPSGIAIVSRRERKQAQNRQIALELLRGKLWEIEEEKKLSQLDAARSSIGRNMRAEKIRTYNYPQNRVTDHRINKSWYALERIVAGELGDIFAQIRFALTQAGVTQQPSL